MLLIDADFQHPLELLPEMHALWLAGYDMVYGVIVDRGFESGTKRVGTGLFYRLINTGKQVKVPPNAGDFRWMDRRVADALNALPERNRFMKGLYAWVGFPSVALDYEPLPRHAGESRYGLSGALGLGTTGLLAFTAAPLRVLGLLGVALAVAALGYGLWVVVEYFWRGINVPGYATLVVGMMFLSGVQLMSVGLLAEYVARIYDEVKQRPLFLVADEAGQGLPPVVRP